MRKRNNSVLGIMLLVAGILFLLDALNVINGILFDGWWTLFLIIPGILSMSRQGINLGNTILVVIGVAFLLDRQGVHLGGYFVPGILIILGLFVLFKK